MEAKLVCFLMRTYFSNHHTTVVLVKIVDVKEFEGTEAKIVCHRPLIRVKFKEIETRLFR
jgi:hypothetical protein